MIFLEIKYWKYIDEFNSKEKNIKRLNESM